MTRTQPLHPRIFQRAAQPDPRALGSLVSARQEQVLALGSAQRAEPAEIDDELVEQITEPESGQGGQRWLSVVRPRARARRDSVTPAEAVTPDTLLARWQQVFELHGAVARLPREYREVLVLSDFEGLEAAQVSWLLDLEPSELDRRLQQARALVREHMAQPADV